MSFTIHQGDALTVLRTMPDESVHCVVTSPPYWGLRDYGVSGQIGLERTPEAYVAKLVEVFREVRRVLRKDGTLWLNIGDSYAGSFGAQAKREGEGVQAINLNRMPDRNVARNARSVGLKPKDLIMIPARVALALQADGWWLRCDIIWAKKNCMPESVTDRPTKAHEYVFLMSKSERYYYDREAILEPMVHGERFHGGYDKPGITRKTAARNGRTMLPQSYNGSTFTNGKTHDARAHLAPVGQGERKEHPGRNARSVWSLASEPTPEAHFATFPIRLAERCILAGCPEDGIILDPFSGAGTAGLAALKHGRRFIGVELNQDYVTLAYDRARRVCPLLLSEAPSNA